MAALDASVVPSAVVTLAVVMAFVVISTGVVVLYVNFNDKVSNQKKF